MKEDGGYPITFQTYSYILLNILSDLVKIRGIVSLLRKLNLYLACSIIFFPVIEQSCLLKY